MSSVSPEPHALSSPQRHCHLLLMLYLPDSTVTLDAICQLNGVDQSVTRQDIAEVGAEIQRYHQLALDQDAQGGYLISGAELDKRLCLFHWLRRALRLTPDFVQHTFALGVKRRLQERQVEKALHDEHNLQALVQHCAQRLSREFTSRDRQFIQLMMQYILCRRTRIEFNESQRAWLASRVEYRVAEEIVRHWQKRCKAAPEPSEVYLCTLLFSHMHVPTVDVARHTHELQLLRAVRQLIQRFQTLSDMCFSDENGLCGQLYSHLSQALERALFGIGIDNSLTEEITYLYPRLLRTTQTAMLDFEQGYNLSFSQEEMGLVTIIFGAWLMQDNALQEKQVLLLTGEDQELERQVEQQLRELTLLPLSIKYLNVNDYQRHSAPKGTALVITPYATPLPLYSPPLIHAELPLQAHQQHRIRQLLES